jgi:hypothetical protein
MKTLRIFMVFCLMGFVAGCVPSKSLIYDTNYDYDIDTDFSKLKRYNWLPIPVTTKIDPLNAKRIVAAIDTLLKDRDLVKTPDQPDFLIELTTGVLKKMDTTGGPTEYGIYEEGRLKLNFIDANAKEIIWQGETRVRLQPNLKPDEKDKLIYDAVVKVLMNFPPPPAG